MFFWLFTKADNSVEFNSHLNLMAQKSFTFYSKSGNIKKKMKSLFWKSSSAFFHVIVQVLQTPGDNNHEKQIKAA